MSIAFDDARKDALEKAVTAVPTEIQERVEESLTRAGLAITPGPLLVVVTAIVSGRIAGRIGHRPFLVGGAFIYAAAGLWFLLMPGTTPDYLYQWLPGVVIDRYGDIVVMQLSSAGAMRWRNVIADAIERVVKPKTILS